MAFVHFHVSILDMGRGRFWGRAAAPPAPKTQARSRGSTGLIAACGRPRSGAVRGGSARPVQACRDAHSGWRGRFRHRPPTGPATENTRNPGCAGRRDARGRAWSQAPARAAGSAGMFTVSPPLPGALVMSALRLSWIGVLRASAKYGDDRTNAPSRF